MALYCKILLKIPPIYNILNYVNNYNYIGKSVLEIRKARKLKDYLLISFRYSSVLTYVIKSFGGEISEKKSE